MVDVATDAPPRIRLATPGALHPLAVAGAALPLVVLVVLRGLVPLQVAGVVYVPVHTVAELAVTSGFLATFAVQWLAAGKQAFRDARARFLGPALLAVAVLEALHFLTFPGMPGFFGPASTERGITYWLAARALTVGALLAAPALSPSARTPWLRRGRLLALNAAIVGSVVAADLSVTAHGLFFVEGKGLTPLKLAIEGALVVASAAGVLLCARAARRSGDRALGRLATALAFTTLSEICFALYATAWDAFNVLGHLYLVAAAWFVFDALFVAALVRPYDELDRLRDHVENELEVTIARLRERTEQRDDLLRAVSHDLRNPLHVVLLQASRLERGGGPDPARLARAIASAGRQMDRMLRDLVDSARLEGGQLVLERRPVALRALVADLLALSEGALETARVTNAVPEELPPVDADPDRLQRVVLNLVANALKYTRGAVTVGADPAGASVRIWVADEGPGIAAEDVPRVFDRYHRGSGRAGDGGLGLGLFIVRRLVEVHGGSVSVDTAPDRGSTFAVTLPAARG